MCIRDSHDADFVDQMRALIDGRREVALIGFKEFMSQQLNALGVKVFDLEEDVRAFNAPLPRVKIIPLTQFDPEVFLR